MTINLEAEARWEELCRSVFTAVHQYMPDDKVVFVLVLQGEKRGQLECTTNTETKSARMMLREVLDRLGVSDDEKPLREFDLARKPS